MNINIVTLTGNLTRDPEVKATASGTAVMHFGIAVNDRVKNSHTGEWEDRPNFFDCTMFGTRAESLSRILRKGIKVGIVGKLHYSSWEKDGQKRSKVEIWPDTVELLTPKQKADNGDYSASQGYSEQAEPDLYDSDLPF